MNHENFSKLSKNNVAIQRLRLTNDVNRIVEDILSANHIRAIADALYSLYNKPYVKNENFITSFDLVHQNVYEGAEYFLENMSDQVSEIPLSVINNVMLYLKGHYPHADKRFWVDLHVLMMTEKGRSMQSLPIVVDKKTVGQLHLQKEYQEKEFVEWAMHRITRAVAKTIKRIIREENYKKFSDESLNEILRRDKTIENLTLTNARLSKINIELNEDLRLKERFIEEEAAEQVHIDEVRQKELMLDMSKSLSETERASYDKQLAIANERLEQSKKREREWKIKASTDPLTKLWNRRYGDQKVDEMVEASMRSKKPISVIYLDLDMFKSINDTFGHDVGDLVLVNVANIIREVMMEEGGIAVRLWGEELGAVMYNCDKEKALRVAKSLQTNIFHNIRIPVVVDGENEKISVSASIGVYTAKPGEERNQILKRADRAMYMAKNGWEDEDGHHPGRDQIVYWRKEFDPEKEEYQPKMNKV